MRGTGVIVGMPRESHELRKVSRLESFLLDVTRYVTARQERHLGDGSRIVERLCADAEGTDARRTPGLDVNRRLAYHESEVDAWAKTATYAVHERSFVEVFPWTERRTSSRPKASAPLVPALQEEVLRLTQSEKGVVRIAKMQRHESRVRVGGLKRVTEDCHQTGKFGRCGIVIGRNRCKTTVGGNSLAAE